MPSKSFCIPPWLERTAPWHLSSLSWSPPSTRTPTTLRDIFRLRFRASTFLAEGSWGLLVTVVVHLFSLLFLISAISIPSVVVSSHFAHVPILRPSLLLLMSCRSTFVQHDSLESPRLHTLYHACSNPPFTTLLDLLHRLAALHAFFLFNYTIKLRLTLYIIVKSEIPYCPEPPLVSRSQDCLLPLGSISPCLIYSTRSRAMYSR